MKKIFIPLIIGCITLPCATPIMAEDNTMDTVLTGAVLTNPLSSNEMADKLTTQGDTDLAGQIKSLNISGYTTGATDSWLTGVLKAGNGWQNMDLSQFMVFDTDASAVITEKYKLAASDLAKAGWGSVPTTGAYENANGFQGYSITGEVASNAASLFTKEYSDVYKSVKNGTFMVDLDENMNNWSEMNKMVDSFTGMLNLEQDKFLNGTMFNAASKGLSSIKANTNVLSNTPSIMAASEMSSKVSQLGVGVDNKSATKYNSNLNDLVIKATQGAAFNNTGSIESAASARFNNAVGWAKNVDGYQGAMEDYNLRKVGAYVGVANLKDNLTQGLLVDGHEKRTLTSDNLDGNKGNNNSNSGSGGSYFSFK